MVMSGSSSTSSSWSALLSDLLGSVAYKDINDEATFQRRFHRECLQNKEPDPLRLSNKFQRQHTHVISFVNVLDKSALSTSPKLSTVFWSKAFEIIVKAFRTGQKDKLFTDCLPKLTGAIPTFRPADLPLHPNKESVQKPLQTIFVEFINCYTRLGDALDSKQRKDTDSFFVKIGEVTKSMDMLKQTWEKAVDQATAAQKAAMDHHSRHFSINSSYAHSTTSANSAHTSVIKFERMETLGNGRYGTVYSVRETSGQSVYAVKEIRLDNEAHANRLLELFQTEANVMRQLRHLHIATVQLSSMEESCLKLYMSPVADCDLHQYMEKCSDGSGNTSPDMMTNVASWFGCLVTALDFAHFHKIIHKDIKPTNILVKDSQVLLTDFGCAEVFEEFNITRSLGADETGTVVYLPPEPISWTKRDVWSLGCVFSEMLTIRQRKSIAEFRAYRSNVDSDCPPSFRENLPKVRQWLDDIVPTRSDFDVLLKRQTLLMLEPNPDLRKEPLDIKRGLRGHWDGYLAFCRACS